MNVEDERSQPLWTAIRRPQPKLLAADTRTDILVIGGGISGLSTAYELARAGRDVVLVDRGGIAGGMTARTSAHLSYEIDDTYAALIDARGERDAALYFQSQKAALDRIEQICVAERIDCDFARVDLFLFSSNAKGRFTLKKELAAARRVGFTGVDWADAPVAERTTGCLRFPNQARFHPLRYLVGLAGAVKRHGGRIYSNTAIQDVRETARGAVATTQSGHKIAAKFVVAATNAPFVHRGSLHNKQTPYRSYVMAANIPKGDAADALIWDTENPYHYVRLQPGKKQDLLIFGGEDHKTGAEDDAAVRLERLEAWARKFFPTLGAVTASWSGQIYEPVDHVPFIGLNPGNKRIFLITGDSGEGLTTAVTASLILADLIAGKKNEWAKIYSPRRKIAAPAPIAAYAAKIAGAAKDIAKKLLGEPVEKGPIQRGAGAIIDIKGEKIAAFRDKNGRLHMLSAACTHVGCTVQWNGFEKCWDCPCHGSQFAATGEVLQGPAVDNLPAVKIKPGADAKGDL